MRLLWIMPLSMSPPCLSNSTADLTNSKAWVEKAGPQLDCFPWANLNAWYLHACNVCCLGWVHMYLGWHVINVHQARKNSDSRKINYHNDKLTCSTHDLVLRFRPFKIKKRVDKAGLIKIHIWYYTLLYYVHICVCMHLKPYSFP